MTNENHVIAKEGVPIIVGTAVAALVASYFNVYSGIGICVWLLFCIYFFRNPKRVTPTESNVLIAPADGKVIFVGEADENHFLKKRMRRVTIFMSPFNVHVNRSPESGVVLGAVHHPGKFLAAFDEKASEQNERFAVHLKTESGTEIVFVQIAGWFARRIICYAKPGDQLQRGKIFGLIKFGSRMDVYFPEDYTSTLKVGDIAAAGATVLARKN